MSSEEEKQRAAIEMELIRQEIQKIEGELIELEKRKIETEMVLSSLDEIGKQKSSETLIPLGSGVFVKGNLSDKKKVFVNVGADVVINKNVKEAREILKKQVSEITKLQKQLENGLREFLENVQQDKRRS
jgi:prefoldin alpha subunit